MTDRVLLQADNDIRNLLQHPEEIGHEIGFKDLTALHGEWIREMVFGEEDYTLQAHRGSFKSSCLAVAISLILILDPKQNIIFLRKTDNDVSEMMGMVSKILRSKILQALVKMIYGQDLEVVNPPAAAARTPASMPRSLPRSANLPAGMRRTWASASWRAGILTAESEGSNGTLGAERRGRFCSSAFGVTSRTVPLFRRPLALSVTELYFGFLGG